MNSMTYKGYFAKINFDERDSIFWGKERFPRVCPKDLLVEKLTRIVLLN